MGGTAVLGNMVMRLTAETIDFQKQLAESKAKSQELKEEIKDSKGSLTDFKSGLDMTRQALEMVGQAYDATIGFAIDYAMQVKDTGAMLGVNAMEASTLIQVLEDLRVETSSLEAASRKMKDQGMLPNIETLIQLSGEYKKIADPVEKATFLFDKFARAGEDMRKVMEAGPDALREMAAAAVESGKAVNDEWVQKMNMMRQVTDDFADRVDALKLKVSYELVSGLMENITAQEAFQKAMEAGIITEGEMNWQTFLAITGTKTYAEALPWLNEQIRYVNESEGTRAANLMGLMVPAVEDVTEVDWLQVEAMDNVAKAAAGLDEAYQIHIIDRAGDVAGAIQEINKAYDAQKVVVGLIEDGIRSMGETEAEVAQVRAVLLLAELKMKGELNEARAQEILDLQTTIERTEGLTKAMDDGLITKYDWLEIMKDGKITQEEYNTALGITSDELSDEEKHLMGVNDELDALNGKNIEADVTINYHSTGSTGSGGGYGSSVNIDIHLAKGGAFWANSPTVMMVGEGGESEYVQVTPKSKMGTDEGAGGGDTYIYNINDRLAMRLALDQARMRRESRLEGLM